MARRGNVELQERLAHKENAAQQVLQEHGELQVNEEHKDYAEQQVQQVIRSVLRGITS